MNLIQRDDRIFIAGHKGMAGSAIGRALRRAGYENQIYVDRSSVDLEDANSVSAWFRSHKPDVVILAAAKVGGIHANSSYPADFLLRNLKIQNNVIESSWMSGVRRLLFLGSSCIYPKFACQPIREEELLSGKLEITNEPYALAKIAGIKLCEALFKQHKFDAISLMPTNLYGPKDNYHPKNSHVLPALISRFVQAVEQNEGSVTCWGSGGPLREFLHVDDLGDACVYVLEKWSLNLENAPRDGEGELLPFLNVGTGKDIPIKELAEMVANICNFKGSILWDTSKPDGTPKKQLDIQRMRELGWLPKIELKDGLVETIREYNVAVESGLVRR